MKIVIYENIDNSLGILYPAPGFSAADIASKDTPTGLPYWIKDSSVLPSSRNDRNSWELDAKAGKPDGYGAK